MAQTAYRPPTTWSVMPPVVKNLLIINGLVFFAMYGLSLGAALNPLGVALRDWAALWPAGTPDVARSPDGLLPVPSFFPWQLLTCGFLHGGFGHLFLNMFGLWMFGMRIENVWGSRRFAVYYFACVLGASAIQLLVTSAPFLFGIGDPVIVPTLGASGGVLGVLLAFGMMYPDEPIYLYFFVPVKAKYLVVGIAVLDLFFGVTGTQAGVANFAHLGGMLTGFLLIQHWRGRLIPRGAAAR